VAQDDPDIQRMRARFVCLRITQMNRVDIRRFEFDFDTTWSSFFLDEKLNVYSRYGGRDETAPEARLNKESLLQTMREVLDVHARRSEGSRQNGEPVVQPVPPETSTPEDIPLLAKNHRGCVHCHQIREYRYLQWGRDNKFDRRKLFTWPLPENVGLKFERGHGHRLESVIKDSPAEQAGLRSGDVVTRIDDVPTRSESDVRWALGHAEDGKPIRVSVERPQANGKSKNIRLVLRPEGDWKQTQIGWRKSMRSVPLSWGFRAYPLLRTQLKELELPPDQLAIRVISVRPFGLSGALGLHKRDLIISLDGASRWRDFDEFKSDMLRRYRPGDKVRLTVLRGSEKKEFQGKFPDWHTDATSVP